MAKERNKIIKGFAWIFAERITQHAISFILQIFLARLLLPEQYGVIAMINVFIAIAGVFVVTGFSSSLIQKKDADDLDFSTIFYCSLFVSVLLYVAIYFCAPFISMFYHMPALTEITRAYSLVLILSSYHSVQRAFVSRKLKFRSFFYSTTIGTILSGVVGIIMAYSGFGVWALVAQNLLNILLNIVVLQFIIEWYPKLIFSFVRAKELMSFGLNILGASLIGTFFMEIRQLLIGKYYTATDLSFYNRGKSMPDLITSNVGSVINTVLFPSMSNHSDDPVALKNMTRRAIKTSSYLMFYFLSLLTIAAKPIIILLLTEKWAPAIPYMQVICLANMIAVLSTVNMQALKASGRGDVLFKLEFLKKPVFLIFVIIAVNVSVMAVAIKMPLYSIYAAYMNMKPNKEVLGYSIKEQLMDFMPAVLLALAMAVTTVPFLFLDINEYLRLFVQLTIGTATYWIFSVIFKVDSLYYLRSIINEKLGTKK